jgi:hypothetical protein
LIDCRTPAIISGSEFRFIKEDLTVITKGDDYPLHQTPDPIAYTGANRNFYDRYFFNGYNRTGDVFFAAALGVYPYVNVMDAAFSVVIDGVQHNVYASKSMHMERLDTTVGPVSIEIIKPLEVLRVLCSDEANGIKADLTFTARTLAHEEPRFTRRAGSQMAMDVTRMMQNGTWQGWIEVKGQRIEVSEYRGTRDRSWGIRTIGDVDPQPNPDASQLQFYWLWAPLNFDEFSTHYFLNDDAEGKSWNGNAVIIPTLESEHALVQMASWSSNIEFESGTRFAKHATIDFLSENDESYRIELNPLWNFSMQGIGYGHKIWKHGSFHGELASGYDEYAVADLDPKNIHIQAMCDVKIITPNGEYHGQGVLEQLVIGPHAPSGFTEMLDFAP